MVARIISDGEATVLLGQISAGKLHARAFIDQLTLQSAWVGPGLGDITAAADALAVPNDMTLVHESSTGNRLCLEECVQMERIYTSRSPHRTTFQVFAGVLSRSGYRCQSWCTEFDEYGSRFSTWTGPGGRTINLVVHPTTGAWADSDLQGIHIDPDSQSYAQLFVS